MQQARSYTCRRGPSIKQVVEPCRSSCPLRVLAARPGQAPHSAELQEGAISTRKRPLADLRIVQQTKLIPPTKARALVARDRLLTRAMDAFDRRLLLITAGAGYGKTSLLVQVHEQLARQHAGLSWFSLDDADNDHVRFLSHLVETLQRASRSFASALAFTLRAAAMRSRARA